MKTHFLLYVADQQRSTKFYERVLNTPPSLNVPGMTEFELGPDAILGLMPESGAERLLKIDLSREKREQRPPRAEIYIVVENPADYHARALQAGAVEVSPMLERNWGHTAAYSFDPDGHVLAFAKVTAD